MKAVYIHIPFCETICSYCDFCKLFYKEDWVDSYLDSLEKEIKKNYRQEEISTIYIGGGTPSCLSYRQLEKLFKILSIVKKSKNLEFTFECNVDIEDDKILLLKENGVNRISMGVQTIDEKHLLFLNRTHTKKQVRDKVYFISKYISNINVDLMYAFPNQTIDQVKNDLGFLLSLPITHISTYSLMIEPNTVLGIKNIQPIDEELDFKMYQLITATLKRNHFTHYEVSNYCLTGYESKHNLVYWNNLEYYGFGLGASGYIRGIRYSNTRSLKNYIAGKFKLEAHILSKNEDMENFIILGLRKMKGISLLEFKKRYNVNLQEIDIVKNLLKEKKLQMKGKFLFINSKNIYISNTILVKFIDLFMEKDYNEIGGIV